MTVLLVHTAHIMAAGVWYVLQQHTLPLMLHTHACMVGQQESCMATAGALVTDTTDQCHAAADPPHRYSESLLQVGDSGSAKVA
jgi:hypothetical protein